MSFRPVRRVLEPPDALAVRLSHSALVISVAPDTPNHCTRCDKPADRLTFELGDRTLCRRCARQSVR